MALCGESEGKIRTILALAEDQDVVDGDAVKKSKVGGASR